MKASMKGSIALRGVSCAMGTHRSGFGAYVLERRVLAFISPDMLYDTKGRRRHIKAMQ